jgi:hypothetical protein
MLAGAVLIGYDVWKTTSEVPISENGSLAIGLGDRDHCLGHQTLTMAQ